MRECQSGSVIIGLPVRVTPNQEMNHVYVEKDKMAHGAPRRLYVSHPRFNAANFCGEETGLSGLLGTDLEVGLKRTETYWMELLALSQHG